MEGAAAEILDDDVRAVLCPDKLFTAEWLSMIESAHGAGFKTTATIMFGIMFGHMDRPAAWARHLIAIRDLQKRTGGFTEFVPLPFVHRETPLYRKGAARANLPRDRADACGGAPGASSAHPQYPDLMGQAGRCGHKSLS